MSTSSPEQSISHLPETEAGQKRALVHVDNTHGLEEFAAGLQSLGFGIYMDSAFSSDRLAIQRKGIQINTAGLSDYITFISTRKQFGILACNFALPSERLKEDAAKFMNIQELNNEEPWTAPHVINIASKSFDRTIVVVDPNDYELVLETVQKPKPEQMDTRRALAVKAQEFLADYHQQLSEVIAQIQPTR